MKKTAIPFVLTLFIIIGMTSTSCWKPDSLKDKMEDESREQAEKKAAKTLREAMEEPSGEEKNKSSVAPESPAAVKKPAAEKPVKPEAAPPAAPSKEKEAAPEKPAKPEAAVPEKQPEAAIKMVKSADGKVSVDGDLSDWTSVPPVILDEQGDLGSGEDKEGRRDKAEIRVAHDSKNLYVAIKVVDGSISNDNAPEDFWQGDCIELFLDVRPPKPAKGPNLGYPSYSVGAYQILLVPQIGEYKPAWFCVDKGCPKIEKMTVKGKLLPEGYTLEAAIPLEQLNGIGPERLDTPIGFEVMVDDIDVKPELRKQLIYSISGKTEHSRDASLFSRACP